MLKQVIILFGPPGAGKGTQSELLSDKLGLYVSETSGIIGKKIAEAQPGAFVEVDGEKYYFAKEKEIADAGTLWDPPFVVTLMLEKIKELADEGRSIIFSGSPRTAYEVEKMMPFIENLYGKENIKIVLIEVEPEVTILRNSNRKTCELMRHSILTNEETKNLTLCPLDGSKLLMRKDDNDPEVIKKRINQYVERTLPMIDYFNKNNFEVNKINGDQTIDKVFNDILNAIEKNGK